ncbi:transcription termination factor Rho [Leucobacter viscericola]|uniref:Transcription termination factor Rho n=1 Tax=Leucobacter viscericola TaxID=2714935 RepID=A0A6G7XDX1_9MICO|nr:transcription termination factor Rho [Leucobacter viscericola]QIK62702.1 transcription termination factor Rho [Leucobacter viscericola]
MEQTTEDTNSTPAAEPAEATEAAPVRRRTSRRATASAGTPAADAAAEAQAAPAAEAAPAEEAPKKRVTRTRKKAVEAPAEDAAPAAEAAATEAPAAEAAPAEEAPKKRVTRTRKKAVEAPAEDAAPAAEAAATEAPAAEAAPAAETAEAPAAPARRTRGRRVQAEAPAAEAAAAEEAAKNEDASDKEQAASSDTEGEAAASKNAANESESGSDGGRTRNRRGRGQKAEAEAPAADSEQASGDSDDSKNRNQGQNGNRNGNAGRNSDKAADESATRSSRTRQRDRKRRGQGDDFEPEIAEDDVLLPIAGILDVLDNYAFVRTSGYLPGTSDVYVSLGQVKKYSLRRGDAVVGSIRQPREGEGSSRQKYNAIVKVDSINGRAVDEDEKRVDIADMTPIFPQERLRMELAPHQMIGRSVDLVAPIGLGQRGVLILPAQIPATRVFDEIAAAVTENKPDAHLMMVLSNALPEEVTQLQRTIRGEVIAATFDRSAEDHTTIAELAVDRARRLVELGHDVVILLDSLNRLARAYAQTQPGGGRGTSESADEYALAQIKRLLSAARNVENGGSLTILATALTKTKVDSDKVLLREVRQVVNSEVRFVETAIGQTPMVDIAASHTQHASAMLGEDEAKALGTVRIALAENGASAKVLERVRAASSNAALLADIQRSGRLS